MFYLLLNSAIVSDSAGEPFEFAKRRQAKEFARGQGLYEIEIVDSLVGRPKRHRHNLRARIIHSGEAFVEARRRKEQERQ